MRRSFVLLVWSLVTLMLVGALLAAAYSKAAKKDIVDTAIAAGQFKTLVKAVQAAGLAETLKGPGPFTVFAPTDTAFAKLPKGTVESLTKPENKEQLKAILLYHVVKGKVTSKGVMAMKSPTMVATVNGAKIEITHKKRWVKVNKAKVTRPDVMATNGVIHVVDTVLMPPKK